MNRREALKIISYQLIASSSLLLTPKPPLLKSTSHETSSKHHFTLSPSTEYQLIHHQQIALRNLTDKDLIINHSTLSFALIELDLNPNLQPITFTSTCFCEEDQQPREIKPNPSGIDIYAGNAFHSVYTHSLDYAQNCLSLAFLLALNYPNTISFDHFLNLPRGPHSIITLKPYQFNCQEL